MSQELEHIHDAEIVQDDEGYWEALVSEWTTGHAEELRGRLRQARAAAAVERRYGAGSMEAFAHEVGTSRSTAYEYARAYNRLLGDFGSHDAVSERLDDSPLTISNVLEAVHEEDTPKALDEAEDAGLSSRQQKAKRRERSIPGNVETVNLIVCPHCGVEYPINHASTRTEAR